MGLALLAILLVAIARTLWRAHATGQASATWAGVVAASAAFAVHSGFDFVWHLPAIVLTVMLLVGLVLPAPDPAPAHMPSIPDEEEEPDGHCCIWRPLKPACSTSVPERHRQCQD